jgi:hypothetical protein
MSQTRHIAMPFWMFALVVILGGCANENPKDLPSSANLKAEGNQKVTWTAPQHGTVYVYDDNNQHLLYSGEVHRGDTLSIDPDNNWIKIGDRKVSENRLDRGRNHRIFFAPARDTMSTGDYDRDHVSGSVRSSDSDVNAEVRTNNNP